MIIERKELITSYLIKIMAKNRGLANEFEMQTDAYLLILELIDLLYSVLEEDLPEMNLPSLSESFYTLAEKVILNKNDLVSADIRSLAEHFDVFLRHITYLTDRGLLFTDGTEDDSGENLKTTIEKLRTLAKTIGMGGYHLPHILTTCADMLFTTYVAVTAANKTRIENYFFFETRYLTKIIAREDYQLLDKTYVPLRGKESSENIELDSYEPIPLAENKAHKMNDKDGIDSIINVANGKPMLQIIGKSGSGKSTLLKKILYTTAQAILAGDTTLRIPFYLNAGEWQENYSISEMLRKFISIPWIIKAFARGRVQLLIDGMNEVPEALRKGIDFDIRETMIHSPGVSIILTERSSKFRKRFDLPLFKLRELNQHQIVSLIKQHPVGNASELWDQIKNDSAILAMACNPLMLKMIIAIASNGQIPKNRGQLYHTFIHSIFETALQQGLQADTDTKVEVLAYVAITMSTEGKVNMPLQDFKALMYAQLQECNNSIPVNKLFEELTDNLVIKVSEREEVSFYHETYQEYFCAVRLKRTFETQRKLFIKFHNRQWLGTILLCAQLIESKTWCTEFFRYLWFGESAPVAKPIAQFTAADINTDITLACKVAFAVKDQHPEIYTLAESYLLNVMQVWKYIYFTTKKQITPLTLLCAAAASLNSAKVYIRLLHNAGWHNILSDLYIESTAAQINETISANVPEFSLLFSIIHKTIEGYDWVGFKSFQLKALADQLLLKPSEDQLKSYYKSFRNFNVFIELLQADPALIKEYNFNLLSISKRMRIIRMLSGNHLRTEWVKTMVLQELKTLKYDDKTVLTFVDHCIVKGINDALFSLMEFLLLHQRRVFEYVSARLQRLPFDSLSPALQDHYLLALKETSLKGISIQGDRIKIPLKGNPALVANDILTGPNQEIVEVMHVQKRKIMDRGWMMLWCADLKSVVKHISTKGQIVFKVDDERFVVGYQAISTRVNYHIIYLKLSSHPKKIKKALCGHSAYAYINDLATSFIYQDVIDIEKEDLYRYEAIVAGKDDALKSLQGCNSLKLAAKLELHNPKRYHPGLLAKVPTAMMQLERNLENPDVQKFISLLGMKHLFGNEVNADYGVVQIKYGNYLRLFNITTQQLQLLRINPAHHEWVHPPMLVVLEENGTLGRLQEGFRPASVTYSESKVMDYLEGAKEGFIYNENSLDDYFFTAAHCNFEPKTGDVVSFIPVENDRKDYKGSLVAACIVKIASSNGKKIVPVCEITEIFRVPEHVSGYAVDLITADKLYFRYSTDEDLDFDLQLDLYEGALFEYKNKKQAKFNNKSPVRLLKPDDWD